ncbi:MAG: ABC transporter ATP-binding protein [Acidobacteria bacterium]|nr:ABC transporter ATP-binding protein [Acidobacteriota bacterium]
MKPVIELEKLKVRYGRTVAVNDISIRAEEGSVYALLGRNGAGKSSIVRCLLGFQKPNGGEARLFGESVWKRRATLMDRVGVVPEDPDAPPEMKPREILEFCSRLYSRWDHESALSRLKRFKVPLETPFGKLSKGQKREVLLAAALASEPELLVLDDPTLGLDVVARKELFEELISDLADRGTTVFVTTHDLPGIEGIADRVGIMLEGEMLVDENLEALKWRFRRIRFTAGGRTADQIDLGSLHPVLRKQWGTGVEIVVDNYSADQLEELRAKSGISEIEVNPLSLEEIFIAVAEADLVKDAS